MEFNINEIKKNYPGEKCCWKPVKEVVLLVHMILIDLRTVSAFCVLNCFLVSQGIAGECPL